MPSRWRSVRRRASVYGPHPCQPFGPWLGPIRRSGSSCEANALRHASDRRHRPGDEGTATRRSSLNTEGGPKMGAPTRRRPTARRRCGAENRSRVGARCPGPPPPLPFSLPPHRTPSIERVTPRSCLRARGQSEPRRSVGAEPQPNTRRDSRSSWGWTRFQAPAPTLHARPAQRILRWVGDKGALPASRPVSTGSMPLARLGPGKHRHQPCSEAE